MGIPKVPSNKKSPPARPGPPVRPPLPKSPKHTPKAGVISVIPQSQQLDGNQRSLPPPPATSGNEYTSVHSTPSPHSSPTNAPPAIPPSLPTTQDTSIKNTTNAIYEEINDDVVRPSFDRETISLINNLPLLLILLVHSKTEGTSTTPSLTRSLV